MTQSRDARDMQLRDPDIRSPLLSWLREQHADDPRTRVLEELKMPRPSARVDVAVINGEIAGFEIKSDVDTMYRLEWQVPAFSRFFDRISVVTTRRHLAAARAHIPSWWGLVLYDGSAFTVRRKPRRNRQSDLTSVLFALSVPELRRVAVALSCKMSKSNPKSDAVQAILAATPDRKMLTGCIREVLSTRYRHPIPESDDGYAC